MGKVRDQIKFRTSCSISVIKKQRDYLMALDKIRKFKLEHPSNKLEKKEEKRAKKSVCDLFRTKAKSKRKKPLLQEPNSLGSFSIEGFSEMEACLSPPHNRLSISPSNFSLYSN